MQEKVVLQNQVNRLPFHKLIIAFSALALGLLASFLDQTSISVIQPKIAEDLHAQATVSWAGTSLMIGQTSFQILSGRLSDIFSRKILLVFCLCLLSLSQLATCFCRTATQLYVFRGFAGVANGGITSLSMIFVSDLVTLQQRGKYQGILGSCVGLGNAVGPFVASGFASRVSWHGNFYFLCPLTAVIAVVSAAILPSPPDFKIKWSNFKNIDYYGFFTSSIGIILFLVAISGGGNTYKWDSALVICLLTIGGVFFAIFLFTQWKISRLPMMPLKVYKSPSVAIMMTQNFLFGMVFYANMYFMPLYFQLVRGWNSYQSSCLTLPMVVVQALTSTISGILISYFQHYNFIIIPGFGFWLLGLCLEFALFTRSVPMVGICFIVLVQGIGVGCVFQPTIIALQAHTRLPDRAVVIATRNFNRSVGAAVGMACCSAILSNQFRSKLRTSNVGLTSEQIQELSKHIYSIDLTAYSPEVRDKLRSITYHALRTVFIFFIPLIGVCFLLGFLIRDRGLQERSEKKEPQNSADAEHNKNQESDDEQSHDEEGEDYTERK
ncbi:hypothetical protein KL949_002934 [Ogataea haglerorum]|nr:hypothetical protein KL950_003401 [Ogataea haglerorum]KAG7709475.1 hypothetical protein KL914_001865 [Ogataea haglerorum]KAG7717660.1 hypothetical protein KL913_002596 [Ogataea haglerorum]KAG7717962.1 hypothetical protein KL949_002934 [Ogataea haglerorum]KAG7761018.1 hypothetical protein KL947_000989 [Ogataea haglerorum]